MRWYLFPLLAGVVVAVAVAVVWAGGGTDNGRSDSPVTQGRDEGTELVAPENGERSGAATSDLQSDAVRGKVEDAAPSQPGVGPENLLDRKLVYRASVNMSVDDVTAQAREVERIATSVGGHVAASQSYVDGDRRLVSMTIRVPAERYRETMDQIRGLAAEVKDERSESQDVTEEYTDLEARLRNLEATERQYLELLGRAENIGEVLQVQDRLNAVRGEIELVQGRIQLLDQLTDLATIDVSLEPVAVAGENGGAPVWQPGRAVERAWDASVQLVAYAAEAVIMAAVFSWWLLPLLAVAAWLGRRWWRRARTERPPEAAGA